MKKKSFTAALREMRERERAAGKSHNWRDQRTRKKGYRDGTLEKPEHKEGLRTYLKDRSWSTNGMVRTKSRYGLRGGKRG